MIKRWLITGCSNGLGRALAERLAAEGDQVLATARRPETLDDLAARFPGSLLTAALDVRDPDQCRSAVDRALAAFGGIDILVNNAAYGQFGALEEVSDAQLAAQFDTNVFGSWRLTRAVLPSWRTQGAGHAIFVSSVAGLVAFPGLAAYNASKFALEGAAETLAVEAAHLGVKVTILQPGGFATGYSAALSVPSERIDAYAPIMDGAFEAMSNMNSNPAINSPELFAEVVWRVSRMPSPPLRLPIGLDAEAMLKSAYADRLDEFDKVVAARHHTDG
ncbi:SDR family oxidoreductase [Dactylosporangium matsuzakiense]|uniref:Short-chain dehydrogenase/reductase n=1 Tax=Dactylosporangium matsuzakiense TaxID=53360 RepID=A0A9W6KU58_9ACTN|nr:SDR family oxidoreductase [Dactylosporangium matsuzakiense]GLL08161.1 short-chain dehydrogenase/reductase [Dactylosporangium matsuzakiense]